MAWRPPYLACFSVCTLFAPNIQLQKYFRVLIHRFAAWWSLRVHCNFADFSTASLMCCLHLLHIFNADLELDYLSTMECQRRVCACPSTTSSNKLGCSPLRLSLVSCIQSIIRFAAWLSLVMSVGRADGSGRGYIQSTDQKTLSPKFVGMYVSLHCFLKSFVVKVDYISLQ